MKVISTNRLNRFWQKGILPIKNALTNKFDKSKILAQREITEAGCVMDGKIASEYFDELNSNLAGLISVEQRGVTLTADWCHIADKSGYYLLAAFNIRGDTNYPVTGIQRPGTGGYTIIIGGGSNGTQHALWLIWGKYT